MSDTHQAQFACETCGKLYAWKPALAGKKARCKCGALILVPVAAPGSEEDQEGLYDLAEDDPPPRPRVAAMGATQQRCPSCNAGMQVGAVICVTCGFNLKTGRKINTAVGRDGASGAVVRPAVGAGALPAVPPGIGPVQTKPAKYDYGQEGQKKMLALGGGIVVLIAGLIGAFVMLRDGSAAESQMKGDDVAILAQMKEEDAIPVEQFLEKSGRIVSGMTPSQARRRIEQFKEMGAREVYAADRVMTRYLVIELPDDPEQRKALFDFENRWHSEMDLKTATDVGQKYLMLRMRL